MARKRHCNLQTQDVDRLRRIVVRDTLEENTALLEAHEATAQTEATVEIHQASGEISFKPRTANSVAALSKDPYRIDSPAGEGAAPATARSAGSVGRASSWCSGCLGLVFSATATTGSKRPLSTSSWRRSRRGVP